MVSQYNRINMEDRNYDIEKTYRVVRMAFGSSYSMSIPERTKDGGITCRTLHFETIDFGGKTYRCAKDHRDRVIYIDTHAMEDALESVCRCGEGPCDRHGTKGKPPYDGSKA